MKKYLSALAALALLFACTPEQNNPDNQGPDKPSGGDDKPASQLQVQCVTGEASDITTSSAKLSGSATISNAKDANGKSCFYYSATRGDANALKGGSKADSGSVAADGGSFVATLSGLDSETTYYYVAAVTIDGQETFGDVKSFSTAEVPKGPTVTGTATDVTEWSAVLTAYANPTPEMGAVVMGILYSTEENPTLENGTLLTSKEVDSNNMYTISATGLASNTTYYYKSTLEYYSGVVRSGDVKSFTTKAIDASVTTFEATEILTDCAILNGKVVVNSSEDLPVESKGFRISLDESTLDGLMANGWWSGDGGVIQEDGRYSLDLKWEWVFLDRKYLINTPFHYVACAKVYDTYFYGDVMVASTPNIVTVVTGDATVSSYTTVELEGSGSYNCRQFLDTDYSLVGSLYYSTTETTTDGLYKNGEVAMGEYDSSDDGTYLSETCTIDNLKPNAKYYYAFMITSRFLGWKPFWGEVKTFETTSNPATSISLDQTELTLFPGETATLSATVLPEDSSDKVQWSSSDEAIATVKDGEVTAVALGEATITAKAGEKTADCVVTVALPASDANAIVVRYYGCRALGTHTDINIYADNQIVSVSGFGVAALKKNWHSATAVVSGVAYKLEAIDGASFSGHQYGNYYWTWAFKDSYVEAALKNASNEPVTIIMTDVNGGKYNLIYKENQSSSYSYYHYGDEEPPKAVDLGLSVKWATWNLGAAKPEDYGDYYAWGETEPKENYSWSTYKWGTSETSLTKYNTDSVYGTVDNKTVLEPEDDVAHVKLGGKWRMPTDAEWTELRTKCTWTWVTNYNGSGINGRLVKATNGNSIFLPAAGYRGGTNLGKAGSDGFYWSSSLNTDRPSHTWYVYFHSGKVYRYGTARYNGQSVRPVSE